MFEKGQRVRASLILFFLFTFLFTLTLRLAYLQIVRSPELEEKARSQWRRTIKIEPQRGIIYDRRMRKLAISLPLYSLYARPKEIENKEEIAEKLSLILEKDPPQILEKLNKEKNFAWLARKMPRDLAERIREPGISNGVGLTEEPKRLYPKGDLACHLLGFAGIDDQGLEGIELSYNRYIKGTPGWLLSTRDARGRNVLSGEYRLYPPSGGYDIILTMDESIQYIAEKELERIYEEQEAKSATIIVMDPKTGEILALANRPSYDLDRFGDYPPDMRRNRAITDLFEPGSALKFVTAAAALAENVVKYEDRFYCEKGSFRVLDHVVHDVKKYEWLTFPEVIEKSSNIGTIKLAQELGPLKLYEYLRSFGFGSLTGIDLPGEVSGVLRKPSKWSGLSMAAVPIGQEISVTAIQLATAASAVANGGVLMGPWVVRAIVSQDGRVIKEFGPLPIRRVISQETASRLTDILKGVVVKGTGTNARVPGYEVAGKTGTAQKMDPKTGRYSQDKAVASFLGWVPADDPRILILVVVDEPKGLTLEGRMVHYGGLIAAPVFREVAQRTLCYLNVPPEKCPRGEVIRVEISNLEPEVIERKELEREEGMPELKGKSMREVLRILNDYDLRPNFIGSGWAVGQNPFPGAPLEEVRGCTVWFASQ